MLRRTHCVSLCLKIYKYRCVRRERRKIEARDTCRTRTRNYFRPSPRDKRLRRFIGETVTNTVAVGPSGTALFSGRMMRRVASRRHTCTLALLVVDIANSARSFLSESCTATDTTGKFMNWSLLQECDTKIYSCSFLKIRASLLPKIWNYVFFLIMTKKTKKKQYTCNLRIRYTFFDTFMSAIYRCNFYNFMS